MQQAQQQKSPINRLVEIDSDVDIPVDLSKLTKVEQYQQQKQQNSINNKLLNNNSNNKSTIKGMDLSITNNNNNCNKNNNNNNGQNQQQPFESHSKHIKKVLKHYQAAANLSLNGPDWFLPIVSPFTNTNGNSSIISHQSSLNHNTALELTKSSNPDNNNSTKTAATLDLRTTPSSTPSINNNNKYLPSNKAAQSTNRSSSLSSLKDIYDPLLAPPPFPIQQPPLLTPPDQGPSRSERSETRLEGELIACFTVGGERRLCVPQIFNIVLRDFSLQQIHQVIEELQINCSTCTRDQMEVLKLAGDIPPMAPSCGLITKTDAHRLCSTLLGAATGGSGAGNPLSKAALDFLNAPYILVYHECFGRCVGRYAPSLYTHSSAQCIQCDECMAAFTPCAFVCHSHKPRENRTVHWGFDPMNWRSYLLPIEDLASYEQTPLMAISNNISTLLADPKNLSHLLLLLKNNNNDNNNNTNNNNNNSKSTNTVPPCCSGGRKSIKSLNIIDNHYASMNSNNKNIENIRSILKEMKCRFSKQQQQHQQQQSMKINKSSTIQHHPINERKRKEMQHHNHYDNLPNQSSKQQLSSLMLSSLDHHHHHQQQQQQQQQQSNNKRIKSESIENQTNNYSFNDGVCSGGGGGGQHDTTLSPFVYPFLQSYLTSGLMPPPPPLSTTQLQCNNDEKQFKYSKESLSQKQLQLQKHTTTMTAAASATTTTSTNYLSALLNGSSNVSTMSNNAVMIADLLNKSSNRKSLELSTDFILAAAAAAASNKSKCVNTNDANANNNNFGQTCNNNNNNNSNSLTALTTTSTTNNVSNVNKLYNLFYNSGGSTTGADFLSLQQHQMANSSAAAAAGTTGNNSISNNVHPNCHPIDRLLNDSLLVANQSHNKILDFNVNSLRSEHHHHHQQQQRHSPNETLNNTNNNNNNKTLIVDDNNISRSSISTNIAINNNNNENTSSLCDETFLKSSSSSSNQKINDNDKIKVEGWPMLSDHRNINTTSPSSIDHYYHRMSNNDGKNLASLIQSPNALMEGNLYNTIHMLQKMRHLCFELGMIPNTFNQAKHRNDPLWKENVISEVETRIQKLQQTIKDSSFDALKRNLSMIEYLIDDILIHFINNNHQIPSTGSMIMERFKKQMFTCIFDMLEDMFADKFSEMNEQKKQQQLSNNNNNNHDNDTNSKTEKDNVTSVKKCSAEKDITIEDKINDDDSIAYGNKNNLLKTIKEEPENSNNDKNNDNDVDCSSMDNKLENSEENSSIQVIEEDENMPTPPPSAKPQAINDDNENIDDDDIHHSNISNDELKHNSAIIQDKNDKKSISATESATKLVDSMIIAQHILANSYPNHSNRSTIEAINEQLTNAISTLAAAAAAAASATSKASLLSSSSSSSSTTSSTSTSPFSPKTVPSNSQSNFLIVGSSNQKNDQSSLSVVTNDADVVSGAKTDTTSTMITATTASTTKLSSPPLLLATASPN